MCLGLFVECLTQTGLKYCSQTPGSLRSFQRSWEDTLFSKSSFLPQVALLWVKSAGVLAQIKEVV